MPEPFLGPPRILPRSEHSISRAHISKSALNVLYGLHKAGYEACLVGGGVRDLLLGVTPEGFRHRHQRVAGTGARHVSQQPADRAPLSPGARALRAGDRRGGHLPRLARQGRGRSRRPPGRRPHPARQRLRHARGRRDPARLHRQRAVLPHRGLLAHRPRRRAGGHRAAPPAHHRRSRGALPRGSGAHAAGGAPGGKARSDHRAGHRGTAVRAGLSAGNRAAGPPVRRGGQAAAVRPRRAQLRTAAATTACSITCFRSSPPRWRRNATG